MTEIEAQAFRAVVLERIGELWNQRRWYRTHHGWIPEQQTEARAELRYLVALARKARALAGPALEREDPVTVAKAEDGYHTYGYHDWQADFNVEGQPEWNGAFTRW